MKRILLLISFLFFSITSFAYPYKELIFFGDSLSDNGNLYRIDFHTLPKSPPYFEGRFSNGPTWAEYIGQYYAEHYKAKYKIYALGGAAILFQPLKQDLINPSTLNVQINQYFLESSAGAKEDVLYAIWIGGNDYLFDISSDADKLTTKVIDKLSEDLLRLINRGAKHLLILNLPDLSNTPYARNGRPLERLALLSRVHNEKLAKAIAKLNKDHKGVDIALFDIYALFNEAIHNPDVFNRRYNTNVKNTQDACWQGGFNLDEATGFHAISKELHMTWRQQTTQPAITVDEMSEMLANSPALLQSYQLGELFAQGIVPCNHPDEFAFWDDVHPSAIVHKVLALIIEDSLNA